MNIFYMFCQIILVTEYFATFVTLVMRTNFLKNIDIVIINITLVINLFLLLTRLFYYTLMRKEICLRRNI